MVQEVRSCIERDRPSYRDRTADDTEDDVETETTGEKADHGKQNDSPDRGRIDGTEGTQHVLDAESPQDKDDDGERNGEPEQ